MDVENDVLGPDYLVALVGALRHIDDDDAAWRAGQLKAGEVGGILRLLPEKVEKAHAVITAFLVRLENIFDLQSRVRDAGASILRPKDAGDFRIKDHRLTPTHALDFRAGFEREDVHGRELTLADGVLGKLGGAVLKFSFTPAQDLERPTGGRNMAERSGLELFPE